MDNIQIVLPECTQDEVSDLLRLLTKSIIQKDDKKRVSGFLGGEYGYGCEYENDTFQMHPFCWCEEENCKWCNRENPNYMHKPSGAQVKWYKYIGRSMEVKMPENFDLGLAIRESINSIT